jgi:hypothetical protein
MIPSSKSRLDLLKLHKSHWDFVLISNILTLSYMYLAPLSQSGLGMRLPLSFWGRSARPLYSVQMALPKSVSSSCGGRGYSFSHFFARVNIAHKKLKERESLVRNCAHLWPWSWWPRIPLCTLALPCGSQQTPPNDHKAYEYITFNLLRRKLKMATMAKIINKEV